MADENKSTLFTTVCFIYITWDVTIYEHGNHQKGLRENINYAL